MEFRNVKSRDMQTMSHSSIPSLPDQNNGWEKRPNPSKQFQLNCLNILKIWTSEKLMALFCVYKYAQIS